MASDKTHTHTYVEINPRSHCTTASPHPLQKSRKRRFSPGARVSPTSFPCCSAGSKQESISIAHRSKNHELNIITHIVSTRLSFSPLTPLWGSYYYSHHISQVETARENISDLPKSHSWEMDSEPGSLRPSLFPQASLYHPASLRCLLVFSHHGKGQPTLSRSLTGNGAVRGSTSPIPKKRSSFHFFMVWLELWFLPATPDWPTWPTSPFYSN